MIDQTLISGEQYQYALIPVYIYVLALGFKGKFNFEQKNEQELIEYKNKLFHCVYGKQAEKVAEHEGFDVHELNNTQGIVATQDLRIGKWLKVLFLQYFPILLPRTLCGSTKQCGFHSLIIKYWNN